MGVEAQDGRPVAVSDAGDGPTAAHGSARTFAAVVGALGTPAFAAELLAALNRSVVVDHLSLMRFEDAAHPPVFESAIWQASDHVVEIQRAYLGGLYRHDPSLALIGSPTGVTLLRVRRDSLPDSAYRDAIYVRAGILERLTVAAVDRRLVTLNLYRRDASGEFSAADVEAIEGVADLLGALAAKHVGMLGALLRSRDRADRLAALVARLQALDGRLTRREVEVMARVLIGMTSEGIALDLAISANTVSTYRKRAYARLGVTSQAELFSLCL